MKSPDSRNISILLLGTLPPPIGGTSVSLQLLVDALRQRKNVNVKVVKTSSIRGQRWHVGAKNFCIAIMDLLRHSQSSDVITLHIGLRALPVLAPIVLGVSLWQRKPLVIRRFGGNDHRELKGPLFKFVDSVLRRADLYMVQTKAQIQAAVEDGFSNTVWFPTSRPIPVGYRPPTRSKCRRFVFLSQVKATKGIPEILAASETLPGDFGIDIYGPLFDGLNKQSFSGYARVRYLGEVEPEKVLGTLAAYDALLLPTYYYGEGYPGIILEAFSLGMPVITTRWKSIPDIVDEGCGILVPPRDPLALREAIVRLGENDTLFRLLSDGALQRQREFDLDFWADKFIDYCRRAIEKHERYNDEKNVSSQSENS